IKDIAEIWPDRQIVVARELTKMFEEFKRGTATELSAYYEEASAPKGEIVILLGPMAKQEAAEEDVLSMLKDAMKDNSLRDASNMVATATGLPKKQVYKMALNLNEA
ncbi:MAG: 16S rRNA (cytidine(1402)-2'-O)-methyltransferase, partial [Alphaproteobacteria bacterium]|nr:16S rRNA (cytidine(1402)-2'-O)-methyltransferase [Alphaproteobacteria bacterium]